MERVHLVVETANDGVESIAMLNQHSFDAVLMDIQMPNMDGYQATKIIRESAKYKELPILAMTAHAMAGDKEKSLAAGMNDHVTKPIDRKVLYASLIKWIPKKERQLPEKPLQETIENSKSTLPDTIPGIDIASALERLNNNQKLCKSILYEFHKDLASTAVDIRRLLASKRQNDQESARNMAHTVKGVAGNFSAQELFDTAFALEIALKEKQQDGVPALLDSFEKALNQVVESIGKLKREEEAIISKDPTTKSSPGPIDMEVLTPLLKELSVIINESNFLAVEVFDVIKPLLSGTSIEIQKELAQLGECIDKLDFQEALTPFAILIEMLNISFEDDVE